MYWIFWNHVDPAYTKKKKKKKKILASELAGILIKQKP